MRSELVALARVLDLVWWGIHEHIHLDIARSSICPHIFGFRVPVFFFRIRFFSKIHVPIDCGVGTLRNDFSVEISAEILVDPKVSPFFSGHDVISDGGLPGSMYIACD